MNEEFDEIRPYHDSELPQIFEELIADPAFRQVVGAVMPGIPFEAIAGQMRACKTKFEFQKTFCYGLLKKIIKEATDGVTLDISALTDRQAAYTYVSNHRDIVLDSGLLSVMLVEQGLDTVEIAIGDNLLIYPWIRNFVRLNKAFIVKRGLALRQQLEASMELSAYIHHTIRDKHQSIWIAQREGRAKDASDETQESVIKMLSLGGGNDIKQSLEELDIVPLTISYEFDPCDYLKAQEMQLKRDNPGYKKEAKDDIQNMSIGISGQKGRIYYLTGTPLNTMLAQLPDGMGKPEMFRTITEWMTREIHRNYTLYPCNYVACDMMEGGQRYAGHYTADDRRQFEDYLQGQLDKIEVPNKDEAFLKRCILNMYMHPVINKQNAK